MQKTQENWSLDLGPDAVDSWREATTAPNTAIGETEELTGAAMQAEGVDSGPLLCNRNGPSQRRGTTHTAAPFPRLTNNIQLPSLA